MDTGEVKESVVVDRVDKDEMSKMCEDALTSDHEIPIGQVQLLTEGGGECQHSEACMLEEDEDYMKDDESPYELLQEALEKICGTESQDPKKAFAYLNCIFSREVDAAVRSNRQQFLFERQNLMRKLCTATGVQYEPVLTPYGVHPVCMIPRRLYMQLKYHYKGSFEDYVRYVIENQLRRIGNYDYRSLKGDLRSPCNLKLTSSEEYPQVSCDGVYTDLPFALIIEETMFIFETDALWSVATTESFEFGADVCRLLDEFRKNYHNILDFMMSERIYHIWKLYSTQSIGVGMQFSIFKSSLKQDKAQDFQQRLVDMIFSIGDDSPAFDWVRHCCKMEVLQMPRESNYNIFLTIVSDK